MEVRRDREADAQIFDEAPRRARAVRGEIDADVEVAVEAQEPRAAISIEIRLRERPLRARRLFPGAATVGGRDAAEVVIERLEGQGRMRSA